MKTRTKVLLSVLCTMILLSVPMLGTLAWLTDDTDTVKNTFSAAAIDIDLTESKDLDLKMVPGKEIAKDPQVTVKANSEDSYVFVMVEPSTNYTDFFGNPGYTVADGWTALTGVAGVYYKTVASSTTDQVINVLADADPATTEVGTNGSVKVLTTVTQEMLSALTEDTYPTLSFTAYAIQQLGFADASAAWAQLNPAPVSGT